MRPPSSTHVPSHAPDVSSTVERRYAISDRLARALFVALCRSMKLTAEANSPKVTAPIYVTAPDDATHDRLWERYRALMPDLDDQLLATTAAFIRTHCGVEMPVAPRRG